MLDDGKRVDRRFFSTASRFGASTALAFRDGEAWKEWSYEQLADRSRTIASWLTDKGVRCGDAVGVVAVRHPDTIAAMIAVLRVGAYYVPLDAAYPEARLRLLCGDAGLKRILAALPCEPGRFPLPVDVLAEAVSPAAHDAAPAPHTGASPAYVMFTSGSTGEPKGVIVPHRAIVRLVNAPNFMRLDADRVFLWLAPLGFDASTLEIWAPLLNGGKCVIYPESWLPTAASLKAAIGPNGVNAMWLTASLFNSIVDQDPRSLSGLSDLLTGGEALSVPHVCKAMTELRGTQIINGYGPTENTTFTACYRIPEGFSHSEVRVPIGFPVSGTEVEIVDDALRPILAGAEGELVALGEGLALGYLNKPALDRERFVAITRLDGVTVRGYRTGDRVVRRADGLIDFLGRFDDQVKIDGHRIEPGETEQAIAALPAVKDCRVLVVTGPAGQKRLAAYVVGWDPARQGELRVLLSQALPAFMVPHYWFFLDRLPVNANGKLDRSALPDPFRATAVPAIEIRSPELAAVLESWMEVLGQLPGSEHVNFFDAGGTSLEAMRLHESLARRFSRDLSPAFVFEHPTARHQADALGFRDRESGETIGRGRQRRSAQVRSAGGRRS
jgi:amino acid adenylation domain-containing protein